MAAVWVIGKNAPVGEHSCKAKNVLEEHSSIFKQDCKVRASEELNLKQLFKEGILSLRCIRMREIPDKN